MAPSATAKKKATSSTSTSTNTSGKKQGTLFSFFKKKQTPSKKPSSSPSQSQSVSKPIPKQHQQQEQPTTKSTATLVTPTTCIIDQVTVGCNIAVYWPDDDEYYTAQVMQHTVHNGKTDTLLEYEDGEEERVNLFEEKFTLVKPRSKCESEGVAAVITTASATVVHVTEPKKRKRIVLEDDEDEDGEFEFKDQEDGDDAYVQEDEGEEEDDDMGADEFIVDSDEDEQEMISSKRKHKRRPVTKDTSKNLRAPVFLSPSPDQQHLHSNSRSPKEQQHQLHKHKHSFQSFKATNSSNNNHTVTPNRLPLTPSPSKTMSKTKALQWIEGAVNPQGAHVHNHYTFLHRENLRDAAGRPLGNKQYNAKTLRVNMQEIVRVNGKKLTPAQEQWWDVKSQYFDCVLLFKTGKFYEMFHMDADVGVTCLNFKYMKGKEAHAGFPEAAYGTMSSRLVQAGYKVARVEQTETPAMLAQRKKRTPKGKKKPAVVNREVCSVLSVGTRTMCYLDGGGVGKYEGKGGGGMLLSIYPMRVGAEDGNADADKKTDTEAVEYGICLIDPIRSVITLGQFADDVLRTRLRTLLTTSDPCEILLHQQDQDDDVQYQVICLCRNTCPNAKLECLQNTEILPKSNAIDAATRNKMDRPVPIYPWCNVQCQSELQRCNYFDFDKKYPEVLQCVIDGGATLAMSAFGACLFYLQRSLIDGEIVSMGDIRGYVPPDVNSDVVKDEAHVDVRGNEGGNMAQALRQISTCSKQSSGNGSASQSESTTSPSTDHLTLDGTTLLNLEIILPSNTPSNTSSLFYKLNQTQTPHGSRLLRAWLLRPLFHKHDIQRRCDAVTSLLGGTAALYLSQALPILRKLPDLERLLSRVHSMSVRDESHPNARAVLYEHATYNKRKVGDFAKLLQGLKRCVNVMDCFALQEDNDSNRKELSPLLQKIVCSPSAGGCFPRDALEQELQWFEENFNIEKAKRGCYEPTRGINLDYDNACDEIDAIHAQLDDYKREMCRTIQGQQWKYINTKPESRDKYLIELAASVKVTNEFQIKGKRGNGAKRVNKYTTPTIDNLVQSLEDALEVQKCAKQDGMRLIFQKFDEARPVWAAAAHATAMLDALAALAAVSSMPGYCRPDLLDYDDNNKVPIIRFQGGRHPCVDTEHFIPNDLNLGGTDGDGNVSSRVLLLSGPNMGGKSTLLRQTCLLCILAQVGCYVPAVSCQITPVDRIFTRLGASDSILQGQSTFFVELAETAAALRGATSRSLVIMDELGRGTATFDGTAIASAAVQHLVEENRCLAMFATHYHSLLADWEDNAGVYLGHMECMVDADTNDDQRITFLYTLGNGVCPKSFGINVARLAGLPKEVIEIAKTKSIEFELEMEKSLSSRIRSAVASGNAAVIENIWNSLQQQ